MTSRDGDVPLGLRMATASAQSQHQLSAPTLLRPIQEMNVLRIPARLRSHQTHIRNFSTATAGTRGRKSFFALRLALASAAHVFLWGTAGVLITKHFLPISGPLIKTPLPTRGSHEDKAVIEALEASASKLAIVKALRADPEYREYKPWSGISEEEQEHRLTPGVLQGAGKIGYNRVWVHKDGSTVGVLSLGRGICGFPNVIV